MSQIENTTGIKLVTKPQIAHTLHEIGANVTKRLIELNIEKLIATEDTMKSLKELRADLNKELSSFEEQRKFIKGEIFKPYNEFETIYTAEISEKYTSAINLLKDKICTVEIKIKEEKKARVKIFYEELCLAEKIDFVPFDKIGLEIGLSVSEKALREKCEAYITKVLDDLNLIKTTDYEAEILAEYKISLNVAHAITSVKDRKEREKQERIRLRQIETNRRIAKLKSIGMIYDEFSKSFVFDTENFMTRQFVEESSNDEFSIKYIECEETIKTIIRNKEKAQHPETPQTAMQFTPPTIVPAQPISAPVVKESQKEEIVTASFEVSGTMTQLQALGQYMRTNNITYKNIE